MIKDLLIFSGSYAVQRLNMLAVVVNLALSLYGAIMRVTPGAWIGSFPFGSDSFCDTVNTLPRSRCQTPTDLLGVQQCNVR